MTPKSGEVELQMAPILAAASIASTAWIPLGRYPEVKRENISHKMTLETAMDLLNCARMTPKRCKLFYWALSRHNILKDCLKYCASISKREMVTENITQMINAAPIAIVAI